MTPSFWYILAAALLYGLLHSILASLPVKNRFRHWMGAAYDRWYRLIFNLVAIITFLPFLALPLLLIDSVIYSIPYPWVLLSSIVQLLAIVVLFIALHQIGIISFLGLQHLLLPGRPAPVQFVTNGLYRYIRHPLYTAGLVFIWFSPFLSWNMLALYLGLTIYLIIGAYLDDRKMLLEFGDSYSQYSQHTPMLIPFLHFPGSRSNS